MGNIKLYIFFLKNLRIFTTYTSNKDSTDANHKKNIKHSRTNNRSDDWLLLRHEHPCKKVSNMKYKATNQFISKVNHLPISEMKTSGALLPAAMNVAPATSWSKFSFCPIISNEFMK